MNKIFSCCFFIFLLSPFFAFAQTPQAIPYQAIVRNASGNIIASQAVKLRFSIHDSISTGTIVYKELHSLTTNPEGLVNINIGQGVVQSGVFNTINWGKNGKFIQTELDALNNNVFTDLGTSQLMSVPYALYAQSSPGGMPTSGALGDILYWNGTQWAPIATGSYGQNLVNCNGVPTWGGCAPILTTNAITNVFTTTATSGGNITNNGGNLILSSGICWSTSQNPTISNSVYNNGSNVLGSYTSYLSGLTPNTTYYVRSFASNSAGITYGNQLTYSTIALRAPAIATGSITNKTAITATAAGNVTDSGTALITSRGICYATTINPTTANSVVASATNSVGSFTVNISGLLPSTSYHYRAYATNTVNTSYGADSVFTTAATSIPTVTTTTVTSITGTTCFSGGNVTYSGGATVTARGVCWSTAINPTVALTTKTTDGSGTGVFTSNVSGLLPNTIYYLRAYATNTVGTAYGSSITITTPKLPVVTTGPITSISYSSAKVNMNVTDSGNRVVLSRGVCYSTTANPTTASSFVVATMVGGIYVSNLTGLTNNTVYHVRAFATTDAGIGYGADSLFTTLSGILPAVSATQLYTCGGDLGDLTLASQISDSGGVRIFAKGFVFGTSSSPTLTKGVVVDPSSSSANIYAPIKGLANNTYYIRSFATNSFGTSYGTEVSFTVNVIIPANPGGPPNPTCDPADPCCPDLNLIYSNQAINISSSGASISVYLNYNLNFYATDGICFGTNPTPTITDSIRVIANSSSNSNLFTLTNLLPNTTYYYRPYSNNAFGLVYGEVMSFTTMSISSVTIGTQVWMNKNLDVATYRNGDLIPKVTDSLQWSGLTTGAWCWYKNDSTTYAATYGRLYNWYALNDSRGIAPLGWHVSSESDWNKLEKSLDAAADTVCFNCYPSLTAGGALKQTGLWTSPNTGATNSSGFTALPAGYRGNNGGFYGIFLNGVFWTAGASDITFSWTRTLIYSDSKIYRNTYNKATGFPVRCVKD
jgi:uncharacterized protein (TIGR02145 family)